MRTDLSRWWELDLLIDRHCEGLLTRAESLRLERLLRADREARRRFLAYLYLDGAMRWEGAVGAAAPIATGLEGEGPAIVGLEDEVPQAMRPREESPWTPWLDMWEQTVCYLTRPALMASVAGMILVTLVTIWFVSGPKASRPIVARLASAVDCQWADEALAAGAPLAVGDELRIASGTVRLTFRCGATVVLEGPMRFLIRSDNAGRLYEGRLIARAPKGAAGFAIEMPGGRVTDLGTVFAISALQGQAAEVHVLEGLVETERLTGWRSTGEKCRLTQGLAMRLVYGLGGPLVFSADPSQFSAVSRLAAGVVRTDGQLRFCEAIPASLLHGDLEDDKTLYVFPERRGVVLNAAQEVLVPDGGVGRVVSRRQTLAAGVRVDSYLLHFDSTINGALHANQPVATGSGSITFERPVVGVIVGNGQLEATDRLLGNVQTRYGGSEKVGENRGLEIDTPHVADVIELHSDGRTVSVKCYNGLPVTDQMRILVTSEGD